MLTDAEKQEVDSQLKQYRHPSGAVVEALRIVQGHRGWVSDDTVCDVATYLGMTEAEVDHVATFYSLIFRHPVGRHVILVCDSVSCWILGYRDLLTHLRSRLGGIELGETTDDGRFTLLPVACLGACDRAPVMMIDEDLHTNLTEDMLDRILEEYP
jgi:NADH-quinone oxidoreductase subunit E